LLNKKWRFPLEGDDEGDSDNNDGDSESEEGDGSGREDNNGLFGGLG
jgi:hypothetical protein